MKRRKYKENHLKRNVRQSIMLNDREISAINQYCEKFKVQNKSKFMREAIITEVLRKFDDNYPTLWDDPQMSLF